MENRSNVPVGDAPGKRFDYIKYDLTAQDLQGAFKLGFAAIELLCNEHLRNGRAKSLVVTKLEEAYMWVGKAIRDDQIERNGYADPNEERTQGVEL